jgi:hypothetical protein
MEQELNLLHGAIETLEAVLRFGSLRRRALRGVDVVKEGKSI